MKPSVTLITLGVDDLERSLVFYRDGLGFATEGIVGQEFAYGAVAFFALQPGLHRFDFRYVQRRGRELPRLRWLPPGAKQFTDFPQQVLLRPATD